jgi:hypothetical protein
VSLSGGRQRPKISFKAAPASVDGVVISAAAIAAAATAAAAEAIAAVIAAETQHPSCRESRAKVALQSVPTVADLATTTASDSKASALDFSPSLFFHLIYRLFHMAFSSFGYLNLTLTLLKRSVLRSSAKEAARRALR